MQDTQACCINIYHYLHVSLSVRLCTIYALPTSPSRNLVTALWYTAQALGVLLNAAIVQIPMALVYQFFFYFTLMLLVTATFMAINCRTCLPAVRYSTVTESRHRTEDMEEKATLEKE